MPDWSKPIILMLLLLASGFGVRARVTSSRARRLERKQQALAADLDAMQSALVPEIPASVGELAVSVAYRPANGPAAGGDFYDAFALDDARVAIILGDVSGHGRVALAHAARMRYTLRSYVEAGLGPREAVKLAGSVIGKSSDGLFTTAVVAVHDSDTASLTYATAGHPPPLTLGEPAHQPLTSCASPPLGWGLPCGRRQTTIPFPKGARACFFSDGLIEARTDHDLVGRGGLATMFAKLGPHPSARALLDEVQDQAERIRDDMAACIVEAVNGPAAGRAQSGREEFELDLDQLARGQGRRFLQACGLPGHEIDDALARAHATAAHHGLALLSVGLPSRAWTVSPSAGPTITASRVPAPRRVPLELVFP